MKIRWLKSALSGLRQIHSHIALENPQAANKTVKLIEQSVANLKTFPNSGREGQVEHTRELVMHGLPYVVIYQVKEDVQILRIFHTAMDWPRRMH